MTKAVENTGSQAGNITRLLRTYADGSAESFNALIPMVYDELKAIAHNQLRRSGVAQVQTTMLVHEAYEKLLKGQTQAPNDRRHFYAIASRAMRQIVVDTFRAESAGKRGGGIGPGTLLTSEMVDIDSSADLLDFDRALDTLAAQSEDLAEVVQLSCFAGLGNDDIAKLTDTNVRTVQRKLARAQAWIATFLGESDA